MTIYFENCLGSCKEAAMELPDSTRISDVLDACIRRWGYGSLRRLRRGNVLAELAWIHDEDGNWLNCCAAKLAPADPAKA